MSWKGFDPKWLENRRRHAAKPAPAKVAAAIDFYRPEGTPVVDFEELTVIDEGARAVGKHGNVVTMRGDLRFDSKKEARTWDALLLQQRAGLYDVVQRQVTFTFTANGVTVGRYRADFVVRKAGETQLHVGDCKSAHTRTLNGWSRTKSLMRSCYGIEVEEW